MHAFYGLDMDEWWVEIGGLDSIVIETASHWVLMWLKKSSESFSFHHPSLNNPILTNFLTMWDLVWMSHDCHVTFPFLAKENTVFCLDFLLREVGLMSHDCHVISYDCIPLVAMVWCLCSWDLVFELWPRTVCVLSWVRLISEWTVRSSYQSSCVTREGKKFAAKKWKKICFDDNAVKMDMICCVQILNPIMFYAVTRLTKTLQGRASHAR